MDGLIPSVFPVKISEIIGSKDISRTINLQDVLFIFQNQTMEESIIELKK